MLMQLELDLDKVTPHGMPYKGGYIEEIHLNATCKVYVRVCTIARWEWDHDREATDEEYNALMDEWLLVDRRQFTGEKSVDYYERNPFISFLPDKSSEKSEGDVCGIWDCPMHRGWVPGKAGHPVSSWLAPSLFGGFVFAFKIEGEPELVMSKVAAKSAAKS